MFTTVVAVMFAFQAMPLPAAGTLPANPVPFEQVRQVALARAANEFPGAQPGTVVPYVDADGATVAYMFHFRTDGKPFPDYEQVAADVQAERLTLTANTNLRTWRSKYAHVLVSARRDRAPVINFGYGTSEYYAIGGRALDRARATLGPDAQLERIYFLGRVTYLEFANGPGRELVLSSHFERSWDSRAAFAAYAHDSRAAVEREFPVDAAATARCHEAEWDRALSGRLGNFSEVFVPNSELAPFYDWSYGCTPTSGAMVMGYIDRTLDYGRLVDWLYQRNDGVEGEMDWQIPNVQQECAIAMSTDTSMGGTSIYSIAYGLETVGDWNGYMLTSTNAQGAQYNDWAWATLTAQIDAGHPMVWSALWQVHSLCGLGYRTEDQFVYVHNTWWTPAEWWAHSGDDWSHVAAVTSAGGDVHKLRLTYPLGDTFYASNGRGETFYVGDTLAITWENSGPAGTSVAIDYSTDGGLNWAPVTASTPDNGSYHWYVPPAIPTCNAVRLRLSQYNGSTYTSGDGSFGNFRVLREPLPPQQLAPPNGLPIMEPPVILVVDSSVASIDSIEFKLIYGLDTIWHQLGTAPRCSLPDNLFQRNRTYKWIERGHNQFGWGPWGATWSFRTMWTAVEESPKTVTPTAFSGPAVAALGRGALQFGVGAPGAGARLVVFDATGNLVRTLAAPRSGRLAWDLRDGAGEQVGAGLYFVRLESPTVNSVRKLVLVE